MILTAKIVLVGDGAVGKTSLRRNFIGAGFKAEYLQTLGADISIQELELEEDGKYHLLKLSIWDIAGQPEFKNIRKNYFMGAHAIFVVYDITNRQSFDNIINWLISIQEIVEIKRLPIILVGNKIDLRDNSNQDQVKTNEGITLCNKIKDQFYHPNIDLPFIETSAKTGENVADAFRKLGKLFLSFHQQN